jgi:predicted AAA+ superfamily ATPase
MLTRHVEPLIAEALTDTPVVLLNGARQTGKSTLVRAVAQRTGKRYLTLDDRVVLAAARSDPAGFVAGLSGSVVMDEVQRVPELFLDLKAAVDRDRTPGRFLLTGSANVLLLPTLADSLAGRMEIISLWPMSQAELAGSPVFNRADWLFDADLESLPLPPCERGALADVLLAGGYPEAVARSSARRRASWFESYLDTILQRDVRDLANLEQLAELPNLLNLLATRSASLLNFAELSRACGLTQTTLKRYFALLETLFLVVRVPAWARNPGKRLVKAPKVFLLDTGLLAWLRDMSADTLRSALGLPGALVETFVAAELHKHLAFSTRGLSLWHYRTAGDIEVDFVLEDRQGRLTGIEVKASASIDASDFKGLRHLQETEEAAFQRGIVLYAGRERVAFSPTLTALPLSAWWAGA